MDYFGSERRTCYGVVLLWVCSIDLSVEAASELDANKVLLSSTGTNCLLSRKFCPHDSKE